MRLSTIMLFLLQSILSFSQTSEIEKILNLELKKETKKQKEDSWDYSGEKFEVVKNFIIKDSILTMTAINSEGKEVREIQTTMKILSIELKKKSYGGDFYTEKQEVDLRKIKSVAKDINVIFETEPDAVKITQVNENGDKSERKSDMFFLQFCYDKQNEYLADDLVEAFKKAKYKIEKGFWHD